jgi:uroporphyrinogen decarboxylase
MGKKYGREWEWQLGLYFPEKKIDFLKSLLDRLYKIYEESAKALIDAGFEVITWADDAAYKERTMIKPELWEELIVPYYTRLNNICHNRGALTFYHSDGYTEPFFNGLIKSGFNGIQSLEPAAGMNLNYLKETYGNKVCFTREYRCFQVTIFRNGARNN